MGQPNEKIVVRYDGAAMKRMAAILIPLAVAVAGIGVGVFFLYRALGKAQETYVMLLVVIELIAGAVLFMGLNHLVKAHNTLVFTVFNGKIYAKRLKNGEADVKSLQGMGATINFGRRSNYREEYGTLEEIAAAPPIPNLTGDVLLQFKDRTLKFGSVGKIMEVMEQLKDFAPDFQIVFWSGQNKREYTYWYPPAPVKKAAPKSGGAENNQEQQK